MLRLKLNHFSEKGPLSGLAMQRQNTDSELSKDKMVYSKISEL